MLVKKTIEIGKIAVLLRGVFCTLHCGGGKVHVLFCWVPQFAGGAV